MAEFITFTTVDGREEATVHLTAPVCLFDETDRGYRAARARASRRIKRALALHPCAKLEVVPRDWSDAIDQFSEAICNAGSTEKANEIRLGLIASLGAVQ